MAVSEAKLEANRRNALKSTGPRTEEGKKNSSLNATKHGLRAETLVLRDEDPQALEERRAAWRACLLPSDDVEQRLVDDAVVYTWHQDRARRAQAGRINANIANYGVDQGQINEIEVEDLGRRLFKDRGGPLAFYPSPSLTERHDFSRNPSTSFAGKGKEDDDTDRPGALVLYLQATLLGCEWMLGEWAKLKAIIDQVQPWLSSDKLKAVRLLGKQPFDAIDERDVAMVFLASFVLKPDKSSWYWEISMELAAKDTRRFLNSAAARELESLKPEDAAHAREVLLGIINRATERLTKNAESHRERARALAAAAPDLLAFDDSPDGERLRRFDLASGRGLARSLGELRRHRHSKTVSGPLLSVVSGPLSVADGTVETRGEARGLAETQLPLVGACPYQPDAQARVSTDQMTRDAHDQPDVQSTKPEVHRTLDGPGLGPSLTRRVGVGSAVPAVTLPGEFTRGAGPIKTNEPTDTHENATNEPNIGPLSVVRGPLPVIGRAVEEVGEHNATNEATLARENATNEATVGPLSVVSCPLPVDGCAVEDIGEQNATNEATDAHENATNELERAGVTLGGHGADPSAGAEETGEENFEEGFSVKTFELVQRACEQVGRARTEFLRELNEEARREAEEGMVLRRAGLRDRKNQNGKPGDRSKQAKTRTERKRETGDAERPTGDLETIVNAATLADASGEWGAPTDSGTLRS